MSDSETIAVSRVTNLAALISELRRLSADVLTEIPDAHVCAFGRTGEPLLLRIIRDTLTDGSEVYNINIE